MRKLLRLGRLGKESTRDLGNRPGSLRPEQDGGAAHHEQHKLTATSADGLTYADEQLRYLANEVKDYQLTHGSILKAVRYQTESEVACQNVNVSLLPTAFPRKHFEEAVAIQKAYNDLYIRVSADGEWMYRIIQPLIEYDSFIAALWEIYVAVRDAGAQQNVVCGVFRSDYMIHQPAHSDQASELKQVEINTFSCAGVCHAERIANMHREMSAVRGLSDAAIPRHLPESHNVESIVNALVAACDIYTSTVSKNRSRRKCVLMPVQPYNYNIADERPVQYALRQRGIACFRCEWRSILQATSLTDDRTLLFSPPVGEGDVEVAVVYYRAGYDAAEYSQDEGKATRTRLEMSLAIKCPNILVHLTNMKAVQQALTSPVELARFMLPEACETLQRTFMYMAVLDDTPAGLEARAIAQDPEQAANYVLKPNRDGGGNNIYRTDIPAFLAKQPIGTWRNFTLMRLIEPPPTSGALMLPQRFCIDSVVSELGIIGTCIWRLKPMESRGDAVQILRNDFAGWTFKTKPSHVDEISVVKGYGCFDCPWLVA